MKGVGEKFGLGFGEKAGLGEKLRAGEMPGL